MKGITKFILFLIIFSSSLLSACGGQQPTDTNTLPNADQLPELNQDGSSVLRGYLSGESFSSSKSIITVTVPVTVDGVGANVYVDFNLSAHTEISSSLTAQSDVHEYLLFNPGSTILDAFPSYGLVDITFQKKDTAFEATAIRETTEGFSLFKQYPMIDHILSTTNAFSQEGVLKGSIFQALNQTDGTVIWQVSVLITMQDVRVKVVLPVHSAADTQIIGSDGIVVPMTNKDPWGSVQITYARQGDLLTAKQVIENR